MNNLFFISANSFAMFSVIIIGIIALAVIAYYLIVMRPVDKKMKEMKDKANRFKNDIRIL